jgi:F-type H+-transporting ATPase subunit delta
MIVADRYANSLMQLAREKGKIDEVMKDMQLILGVAKESHELGLMLKSPVIKTDKKQHVLEAIFKGKISDMSMSFVRLITAKRRESVLVDIARAFNEQYKRDKNIFTAVVTSASGLDDKTRQKMLEMIRTQMKGEVELIEKIDKDTIGGFVLRIGDRQIDKSVARQLSNLKKELVNRELN